MTKNLLFRKHHVIVGSLVLKKKKTLAIVWEANYFSNGIINWSFPM
jgi:hypothetical protein